MRRTIESHIEIRSDLEADLSHITVDPTSLQGTIINLLVNSRDALGDGGHITIETKSFFVADRRLPGSSNNVDNGNYVKLAVTDNGPGMEASTIANVFTPFFTTKPVGKGVGLGLSGMQGFVRQSGGTIVVYSEMGRGTRVEIYFRANVSSPNTASPPAALEKPSTKGNSRAANFKILIAEDEKEVRDILRKTLVIEGFDVVEAKNGDHGFSIFKNDPTFNLIVSDFMIPGELQGPAMAVACREIRPEMPVIFLSGYLNEMTAPQEGILAADIRLTKPVPKDTLLNAMQKELGILVD